VPDQFIGKSGRLPVESGRFLPRHRRFGPPPAPSSRPADLLAKSADYRPKQADFCPVAAKSLSPRPPSAPLSTGPNGERRIHCSVELGRPNTIYMSSGPSGPIFTFLIQFKFYPTKRSIFENFSPPMFLEFHLVFYIIFLDFFLFFLKFSNLNFKYR
jgi:hypothetical protein